MISHIKPLSTYCSAISRLQVKKGHVFFKAVCPGLKSCLWKTRLKSVAGIQGYTQNSAQLRREASKSVLPTLLSRFFGHDTLKFVSAIVETNYDAV
jgi:hypothetical protein